MKQNTYEAPAIRMQNMNMESALLTTSLETSTGDNTGGNTPTPGTSDTQENPGKEHHAWDLWEEEDE